VAARRRGDPVLVGRRASPPAADSECDAPGRVHAGGASHGHPGRRKADLCRSLLRNRVRRDLRDRSDPGGGNLPPGAASLSLRQPARRHPQHPRPCHRRAARSARARSAPPTIRRAAALNVHLLDGTYELFRHFYALPRQQTRDGQEVAAIAGVVGSVLSMLEGGATHLGVATDHVIESFRNDLWAGYKTSAGIEPELLAQFQPLEDALRAMGVVVWAMEEFEADDALAAAARLAVESPDVEQVIICTPDKDLSQCVRGERVVQLDRRKREVRDEGGVVARFGVGPASIPDYLALVGDSADGFPGIPGWGEKASSAILARYVHLEGIPTSHAQ